MATTTVTTDLEAVRGWLTGRLPADLYTAAPQITLDRDEIVVVGAIGPAETELPSEIERTAAAEGRLRRFREDTREQRMAVAREAEARFGRKVAWGAECDGVRQVFTSIAVPVMTRLRQPERLVLDTLVDAGVARSRADALAWCVKLVGTHSEQWLGQLREAMQHVERVRDQGPTG